MKFRLRTFLSCVLFFFLCYLIFDITDPSASMALRWPQRIPMYAEVTLAPGADILHFLVRNPNRILAFRNLAGNMLLFAPVGFLLPLFWPYWRKWYRAVGFGAVLSLVIELCQLLNFRATVTDDFLLNTLGTALGYGCFWVLARLSGRLKGEMAGKWMPFYTAAAALLMYNLIDLAQFLCYV